MNIEEYRKKGLHLPIEFRDFHDQKDIFKQIGGMEYYGKQISWIEAQVYTIDYFLWIMAKYGFELRKTNRKVPREDLSLAIERRKREESEAFLKAMQEERNKK